MSVKSTQQNRHRRFHHENLETRQLLDAAGGATLLAAAPEEESIYVASPQAEDDMGGMVPVGGADSGDEDKGTVITPPPVVHPLHLDDDGRPDGIDLDYDGDGNMDERRGDRDNDGRIDGHFFDVDDDGNFDYGIFDVDLDGRFDHEWRANPVGPPTVTKIEPRLPLVDPSHPDPNGDGLPEVISFEATDAVLGNLGQVDDGSAPPATVVGSEGEHAFEIDDEEGGGDAGDAELTAEQREVAALIPQLGSEEWEVRDKATRRLVEIAGSTSDHDGLRTALATASAATEDLEVKQRIGRVIQRLDERVADQRAVDQALANIVAHPRDVAFFRQQAIRLQSLALKGTANSQYVHARVSELLNDLPMMGRLHPHIESGLGHLHFLTGQWSKFKH